MKNKLNIIILVFLMTFCLAGCSNSNKTIEDKSSAELSYVEDTIFTIVNKYSKDEYKTKNGLEWDNIKKDAKKISNEIDTIVLDLSELGIPNEDLIKFSSELNNLIVIISDEDEKMMIDKLSYLYSLVPKYMASYSDNVNKIKQKELKSIILSSYNLSNLDRWEDAKLVVQEAENKYKDMMNDVDYMHEYSYNLNKIYVLVEELKNAINLENIELVKIKYINIVESI